MEEDTAQRGLGSGEATPMAQREVPKLWRLTQRDNLDQEGARPPHPKGDVQESGRDGECSAAERDCGSLPSSIPSWVLLPFPVTLTQPAPVPHGGATGPFSKPVVRLSRCGRGSLRRAQEGFPSCLHHHTITLPPFKSKRLPGQFPSRHTKLQPLAAAGLNAAEVQKMGQTSSCVLSIFLKANTRTELSLFKIKHLFSLYMLVRKGFSRSLCFDVKTNAFFVFMTSFH